MAFDGDIHQWRSGGGIVAVLFDSAVEVARQTITPGDRWLKFGPGLVVMRPRVTILRGGEPIWEHTLECPLTGRDDLSIQLW